MNPPSSFPLTVSEQLQADPAFSAAIETALASLASHAARVDGIRAPIAERQTAYDAAIADFGQIRGGKLFFPFLGSGLGCGPFVELADGSVKLDFINGIGALPFGHSHPAVTDAAIRASLTNAVMHGNLQQNATGASFSTKLLAMANRNRPVFDHCFLSSTGVMAGENMLKIAFQAREPATRVLAFSGCFAGRTLAFSQITDKAAYRQGLPSTLEVDYVPFYDERDPDGSTDRALNALRQHLSRYPNQHAAFIYELVQGEGGFYPGSSDFFTALMRLCREQGVLNVCDEVQTFARTHQAFAYQHFGLDEWVDGVWIGKASQVCATLFKSVHQPKPGLLSQTFTSSAVAIAAGERILALLDDGGFFGDDGLIAQRAAEFHDKLIALSRRHPDRVKGPFGVGAMTAFTPFDGTPAQAQAVVRALYAEGVMSFVAGAGPMRVRFLWPVGVTESRHIDLALEKLESVLSTLAVNHGA
jgi:4-aminobutyrate aminotransferase-like enzyme